ncbi:MAG: glutaredoxin family protein [Spirochaetes bacterium]|nr:glutaredoxin family protein [Spirochaetota bacterium]MBN2772346.1 glutaredoxin family protein [Spirochaetota bacterium]
MKFDKFTRVEGDSCGTIQLFGLSTCIWCKKTKEYLDSKGVEYYYVFVDLLNESEKEEAKKLIKKWNNDISYPTIIINESRSVVGFDEDEIDREIARNE